MRSEGHAVVPLRGDVRSVTVPGAVDGWLALHGRYGRLPLDTVLGPAIELAEEGFVASLLLAFASHLVAGLTGTGELCPDGPLEPGRLVRLPGIARTLRAVAAGGRDGFYRGEFGRALTGLGAGVLTDDDLGRSAGRVARAVAAPGLGPRSVDGPASVAGVSDARRRVDRRAPGDGCRPGRPRLGAPGGGGGTGGRPRSAPGPPRCR